MSKQSIYDPYSPKKSLKVSYAKEYEYQLHVRAFNHHMESGNNRTQLLRKHLNEIIRLKMKIIKRNYCE